MNYLGIAIGAVAGALSRYFLGILLNTFAFAVPLGTLAANLLGSLLIGFLIPLTSRHTFFPEALRLTLITGFCGSFTTFSTFSAETIYLFSHEQYFWASAIILLHVAGSLAMTFLGMHLAKLLFI
ncbi:MAG: fluoride efflux transporter CrcB [Simkaniaceae bacterium]